jgi:hypothetical protein
MTISAPCGRVHGVPCSIPAEEAAELVDLLQNAETGSNELDARIAAALVRRAGGAAGAAAAQRWSQDMVAVLPLIPADHNFSIGRRDGVVWVWIQPNDGWNPAAHEWRHDHPWGSGLVVAQTIPLAVAAAIVQLHKRCRCAALGRFDRLSA